MATVVTSLSILTTSLCIFLKIPQISTIVSRKSVDGLSHSSLAMEFFCYCNMIAYHVLKGYRISLYLEYPPLLISNTIIILLILKYCASSTKSLKLTLLMTFLLYLLIFTGFISSNLITHLVTASIPLGIMSKVIQLWKIISTKQSGSVSGLSWALNATAGFSRLISLILSVGDTFLIFSLTCSASLNTAVALAAFYYSKNTLVQPTKND